jgi:hypothetical protein
MHNRHAWTERTEDGEKREVRAEKFGKVWRIQAKLKSEDRWTYYDKPELHDLVALKDNLERKYQRRRASYEDVQSVEALIREER